MSTQRDYYQNLVRLILPEELFEYFEVTNLVIEDRSVSVFLEELNVIPEGFSGEKLTSKGFYPTTIIQDFPIRNKALYLHVRRRRWLVESTKEVVSRDWDSVAEGTRYTKSFADFLKGLFGQLPDQQ
jgi:hypothetical protein